MSKRSEKDEKTLFPVMPHVPSSFLNTLLVTHTILINEFLTLLQESHI